jgi:hypothetical protein
LSDKRRDWFPVRLTHGCASSAIITAGTLLMGGFRYYPWWLMGLFFAMWAVVQLCQRRGIVLHDDGLTLVGWFGRRHVPWELIGDIQDKGDVVTFKAAAKRVTLAEDTDGWDRLFSEIQRRVAPEPSPAGKAVQVAAGEVAQCLGIPVDGALECRPGYGGQALYNGCVAAYFLAAAAFIWGGWRIPVASLSVAAIWRLLERERRSRVIRADVNGLVVGNRRASLRVPWSAVRSIDRTANKLRATTDAGRIVFDAKDSGSAQLEAGIRRLLAARDAGRALPSAEPVSAAAISQARLTGEAPEAALSRAQTGGKA